MKKILTLCFMIILMITVLFIKHLGAQNLWVENIKTSERKYFNVNQSIRYRLNTSINFHKGRIISFTDTSLTVQIKGGRLVTLPFRNLSAIKVPRSGGRTAGGVLMVSLGTVSLLAAIGASSSHSNPPSSSSSNGMFYGSLGASVGNEINKEVAAAGFTIALLTLPMGIILLDGKTINLNKDWTLKTK